MTDDSKHFMEISFDWGNGQPSLKFVCQADEDAACRRIPTCYALRTDDPRSCIEYEGRHQEGCELKNNYTRVEECFIAGWMNEADCRDNGEGKVVIPVTTEWEGEYYSWAVDPARPVL